MHSILERITAEEEEDEENDGHYQEEEEGGAHSLKDVCDLRRPAPSPFSSRRVMFENEQVLWTYALVVAAGVLGFSLVVAAFMVQLLKLLSGLVLLNV